MAVILLLACTARMYLLSERPGYEWDESVYAFITEQTAQLGYPALRAEGGAGVTPFLYHPPFDFHARAAWQRITGLGTLQSGRLYSALMSVVGLALFYLLMREITSRGVALAALLLVGTDGWMIFSNRLNVIENSLFPLYVLALAAFATAVRSGMHRYFLLAGALIGTTVICKHTGGWMLLFPALHYLYTRREARGHMLAYAVAFAVIGLYVLGMTLVWGEVYFTQTWIQVERALGIINSRGLNFGFREAFEAVRSAYGIYVSTLIVLVVGSVLVARDTLVGFYTRRAPAQPILLAWALAALIFLGAIALRAPQYLVIVLVPLYAYTVACIGPLLYARSRVSALAVLAVLFCFNTATWYTRFIAYDDNALRETYTYMEKRVPQRARVLTEEPIGVGIAQPYYQLDKYATDADKLASLAPEYVVLYESVTQKPPESEPLRRLVSESEQVFAAKGFKETITVYRTPSMR